MLSYLVGIGGAFLLAAFFATIAIKSREDKDADKIR